MTYTLFFRLDLIELTAYGSILAKSQSMYTWAKNLKGKKKEKKKKTTVSNYRRM